jgi:hypothetical protein
MLTITNTAVTREQVWTAFRRTHNARRRERYHSGAHAPPEIIVSSATR